VAFQGRSVRIDAGILIRFQGPQIREPNACFGDRGPKKRPNQEEGSNAHRLPKVQRKRLLATQQYAESRYIQRNKKAAAFFFHPV
jgi:hypothetical protein